MAWTRSTLGLSIACLLVAAAPAVAQTPAKQADQLNEQGKALLNAKPMRPAEATLKFRAAIVLSPEGRFYLNLCMSLYQEGKLSEALTACDAVSGKGATPAQVKQAGVITDKFIKPKMREAGIDPDNPNNGNNTDPNNGNNTDPNNGNNTNPNNGNNTDPNNGNNTDPNNGNNTDPNNGNNTDPNNGHQTDPNNGNQTGVVVPPPPSLLTQTTAAPTNEYTWTIGAQFLGLATTMGEKGDWKKNAGGFRILGDYAISRDKQFGAQGYLSYFNVGATDANVLHMDESLSVLDLGVGVYKEVCKGRLCLKPLAGAQIALLLPSDTFDNQGFSALGVRGEVGVEYALGSRYENVITLGLGVNVYFPASESDGATDVPADWGLDKSSANGYFAIGYTRRFATPLGSQPLFTLQ